MTTTPTPLATDATIIDQLISVLDDAGVTPARGARLLRQTADELRHREPSAQSAVDGTGVARSVPDELLVSVLIGALDDDEAIARGLLAASAATAEERRRILFDSTVATTTEGE